MTCLKPRPVARLFAVNKKGNRKIYWTIPEWLSPRVYERMMVSCGQCIDCKLEYSRQWAIRIVHEAALYEKNCFITLTIDEDNIDKVCPNKSLNKKAFKDFMKRFRKKFVPKCPYSRAEAKENLDIAKLRKDWLFENRIRYFHCGEYGDKKGRPHYHACIFNFNFSDLKYFKTRKGKKLYTSDALSKLWTFGHCSVGTLEFESAAYVARYCTKKVSGKKAQEHYERVNFETGEVIDIQPEYATMSRDGGIGKEFFNLYNKGWYPQDALVIRNGIKCKPPKYYDSLYEKNNSFSMEVIKRRRVERAKGSEDDNDIWRLESKEKVLRAKLAIYSNRDLE